MNEMRRAALTIHALQEDDRRWILARLAPQIQQALEPLLAELAELGIPADSRLIEEVLQGQPGTDSAQVQAPWRRELAAADARRLEELLQGEPPAMVARILSAGPWPWEHDLLAGLPPDRRDAVLAGREALVSRPGARALDEWLAQRLQGRCASRPSAAADLPAVTFEGSA